MKTMGFLATQSSNITTSDSFGRFEHTLFSGKTGDGKTTCGINPVLESRIKAGYGMLIFDEKAKEHRVVKNLAHKHGRLADVVEIGKPHGAKINLFSNMSEKQVEKFARSIIKDTSDPFWSDGGVALFVDLSTFLMRLKALHKYAREEFGITTTVMSQTAPDKDVTYHLDIPLEPLTMREFGGYVKKLKNYIMLIGTASKYVEDIKKQVVVCLHEMGLTTLLARKKLTDFDALVYELEEIVETIKGSKVKQDATEASGFNGMLFMIQASISGFMKNPYCNEPISQDIAGLLNEGKIVVINSESFTGPVLSVILDKTLDFLSLRAKHKDPLPVAIVIDEANRVLGNGNDIRTDILRESKVEVVMAIQNDEQMIRKMGEITWSSMKQNFKTQISFNGQSEKTGIFKAYDEISCSNMQRNAMFFEEKALDVTEILYQEMHGHYAAYQTSKAELMVYDHLFYDISRMLIFRNINTKEERHVHYQFEIPNQEDRLNNYFKALFALNDYDQQKEEDRDIKFKVKYA
ncbi:MAG: TraM recognition domain-containing protein [Agitococcus sp.]|nr:TraM recognition domain-containing protein [Agitococcus sp.]